MKTIFAEINSLEKEELLDMFQYICSNIILKTVPETKRELGIGREQSPNGKHIMELIKKHNISFTLRIRHEKVVSTMEERAEAKKAETPDLNSTLQVPSFIKELENQNKDVKNPDLKIMSFDPSPHESIQQTPTPELPPL